ncbi:MULTISPECIES: PadR family transcriptional regulator [Brachybacterium]|uniref:Predicted transcriptional regulator n=2 Tax=Brachybacterium TaxID=43668 RepID=C7MI62_BRAFD|nr:helix-turn-helix transcriptional regulator [Brachybacterium faecium]ACU84488.1 predicted transcriptional regulator [Brachybacterium faecium DSM 4810]HJF50447.1 PadR family transcriptional regulator [Brachybacterium paraconglomeratum]HJG51533.1 PadR family transcriptional regulator [Brachybacterium faecium]
MSIRAAMLALLSAGEATTYQLRKSFDEATGQVQPVNIGQVSSTLSRLERDGCIERGPADPEDSTAGTWRLTGRGRDELEHWWESTVDRARPDRHELVLKLSLAVVVPGMDVTALVQRQRTATLSALHEATRARRGIAESDLAARLVLDHHLFAVEAELRWLDDVEGTLERAAARLDAPPEPAAARTAPRQEARR